MRLGVSLTTLLFWAVFGFAIGFIVSTLYSNQVRGGILGTAVLGILGAFVGGLLLISFIYRLLFQQKLLQ